VFANNVAGNGAGVGVSASNGAQCNPQFIDCSFYNNRATAQGGGLYLQTLDNSTVNVQVTNCQFTQNQGFNPGVTAARAGALGLYAFGVNSNITCNVTGSSFTGNSCEQWGGAVWNYARAGSVCNINISNSSFTGNSSNSGSAIHSHAQGGPVNCNVTQTTFLNNTSQYMGAAIRNYCELAGGNGLMNVTGCTFTNNVATLGGGAIANVSMRSSVATLNVSRSFFNNNGAQRGGAYYNSSSVLSATNPGTDAIGNFTNCAFWSNDGITTGTNIGQGGAIFQATVSSAPATSTFMNCSFHANAAQQGSVAFNNAGTSTPPSPSLLRFVNSIAVGNPASGTSRTFHSLGTAGTFNVSFTHLDQTTFANNHTGNGVFTNGGSNLLLATPAASVFVNPATGDLHLISGAPGINMGTLANAPTVDIDGDARPNGQGIDMGCDERTTPLLFARQQPTGNEAVSATVFPNPTTGRTTVSFSETLSGTLQVFDLEGRLIATQGLFEAQQADLDLSAEASGLYLVRIVSGNRILTYKVTVKKP
jgi:predicted outer membrane repeat protein